MMCRLLEVSRAGFNAAQRRPPSARAVDDARLCVDVRTEFRKSRRRFGASVDTSNPATDRHLKTGHHDDGLRLVIGSA